MNGSKNKYAFVVSFSSDADFDRGVIIGRVEHVSSYESERFQSLDELLSFVSRVSAKVRAGGGEQG